MRIILIILCMQMILLEVVWADISDQKAVQHFIQDMTQRHGFSDDSLSQLFKAIKPSKSVLELISKPAEKKPWYKYRPIFLNQQRIDRGVLFWRQHEESLKRAEQEFGVNAEIIVAIIGVESFYGRFSGRHHVLDALATLAFYFPKRRSFFRSELEQYLLLTREQAIDPRSLKGSYAGAMGIPQFISSSYRRYAVDFDRDGKIDIWDNKKDVIGSVANYFHHHDWRRDQKTAIMARSKNDQYKRVLYQDLKPKLPYASLHEAGVIADEPVPREAKVKLLELETEAGKELWIGLHNFYVITRYNHSVLYAMAVYQLSTQIKQQYSILFP